MIKSKPVRRKLTGLLIKNMSGALKQIDKKTRVENRWDHLTIDGYSSENEEKVQQKLSCIFEKSLTS